MLAKSQQQQKFMGMVHAIQKGKLDPRKVSPRMRKVAKTMDYGDVRDFAKTKRSELPKRVEKLAVGEDLSQVAEHLYGLLISDKRIFKTNEGSKMELSQNALIVLETLATTSAFLPDATKGTVRRALKKDPTEAIMFGGVGKQRKIDAKRLKAIKRFKKAREVMRKTPNK